MARPLRLPLVLTQPGSELVREFGVVWRAFGDAKLSKVLSSPHQFARDLGCYQLGREPDVVPGPAHDLVPSVLELALSSALGLQVCPDLLVAEPVFREPVGLPNDTLFAPKEVHPVPATQRLLQVWFRKPSTQEPISRNRLEGGLRSPVGLRRYKQRCVAATHMGQPSA